MQEDKILKVIGQNIRKARVQVGLTQECLAELLDLHSQTVSNLERGKHPFAVTTFALITQFLEVDAQQLLAGLPIPNAKRTARIKKALARRRSPPNHI